MQYSQRVAGAAAAKVIHFDEGCPHSAARSLEHYRSAMNPAADDGDIERFALERVEVTSNH